jgi:signal transduction histidine kinase
MVGIMVPESLFAILKRNRDSILEAMCASLGANVSSHYQDFILNSQDGKRRLSIFLDMSLEALNSSPERFYQDQQKVGYYRAVQGYSLGDVTIVAASFIEASSKALQRQYEYADAIPHKLVKELIEANKIILNSVCLVGQSYIVTREERIASEINNIKLLYHFTQNIMSIFDLDDVSSFVSAELVKVFPTDIVLVTLSRSGRLDNTFTNHNAKDVSKLFPVMEKAWKENTNLFVAEEGEVFLDMDMYRLKKAVIAPIMGHETCHGVVMLASFDKGFQFTKKGMDLLEQFLLITTIVIDNSLLFKKLQLSSQRMSLLTRQTLKIREEEKKRIAEDIHDTLTQTLTGISYKLQYCFEVCKQQPNSLRRELAELIPTVQEAITQSRELTFSLHPDIIDNIGLVAALERLASNVLQHNKIDVSLDLSPNLKLPSHMTLCLYRVAQEALANVIKHAKAKKIQVILECVNGNISLQISDDGKGFDVASSQDRFPFDSKFGLFYIQQRMESMGGKLTIKSKPNAGCLVNVTFPLKLKMGV